MSNDGRGASGYGWLTGEEIVRQRERGQIIIEPFSADAVNPNSYNYRLGPNLQRLTGSVIDLKGRDVFELIELSDAGTRLEPGECYLGSTEETFGSPAFASLVTGRSSVGRKFTTNHVTAGLVDVGFVGQITLEITVQKPTIVYPRLPFGQIYWFTLSGVATQYRGRYQGQRSPTASRLRHDQRGGDGSIGPGGAESMTRPPTIVIFEAHGTSVDNETSVASGHADPPLSAVGEEQAEQLGRRYSTTQLDKVYCSDLQRSYRTAEIAFAGRSIPIVRDRRLRECDYGVLTRAPGSVVGAVRGDHVDVPFERGQSYRECAVLVAAVLQEIETTQRGGTVLVIGHRATQYGLECSLRGRQLLDAVTAAWEWQPGWTYLLPARVGL